jgi:hypothetical protein
MILNLNIHKHFIARWIFTHHRGAWTMEDNPLGDITGVFHTASNVRKALTKMARALKNFKEIPTTTQLFNASAKAGSTGIGTVFFCHTRNTPLSFSYGICAGTIQVCEYVLLILLFFDFFFEKYQIYV